MLTHFANVEWPWLLLGGLCLFGGLADFLAVGLVAFVRHERELRRRATAYVEREDAASTPRVMWP